MFVSNQTFYKVQTSTEPGKKYLIAYLESGNRNKDIISYHTSASGIRKLSKVWDADALYFFAFHEHACDNEFIFQSHLQRAKFKTSGRYFMRRYFTRTKFRM